LLALLTLGIFIGCFDGIDIGRAVHSPFAGNNIISDINSNELGFLAGIPFTVSSTSLLLDQRSKSSFPGSNTLWNSLFIVTAIVSGYLVITSQSKAVILGICIAIASVLFLRILISRFNYNRQGRKSTVIAVSTLAIFCVITFTPIGQVLIKRFDGLGETLLMLANGDIEVMSGLELILKDRLEMWRESVSLIADAPLIGHGPGTAPALLAKSSYSEIAHYQHFHSLWLHLLVIIGIVGTLGFAALFLSLSITSAKGAINHDKYISWLSLGLWVYFLVIIVAQLRINHPSGEAFVILVGGMSYYCGFSTLQNTSKR
ncbi:MAG: O-antigen ligase family protein, partial [Gammaproteobacteria bacterium]|nr:O-antigen ligase family protein [Gammaproteobacteria bacterium]